MEVKLQGKIFLYQYENFKNGEWIYFMDNKNNLVIQGEDSYRLNISISPDECEIRKTYHVLK